MPEWNGFNPFPHMVFGWSLTQVCHRPLVMKTSVADQQTLAKAFLHITVEVLGNTATDDKEIFLEWKPDSVVGGSEGGWQWMEKTVSSRRNGKNTAQQWREREAAQQILSGFSKGRTFQEATC